MKKAIRTIGLLLVLTVTLGSLFKVLSLKLLDGIYSYKIYYEQPKDSLDVLFVGSSHVYEGIDTSLLWDEYDLMSYDLCGSAQCMWNTYYFVKDATKYQKPEVVVVDLFSVAIVESEKAAAWSEINGVKSTYGMKLSRDKIENVMATFEKDKWATHILEYPEFHTRYTEVSQNDFEKYPGVPNIENWKGFSMNVATIDISSQVNEYSDDVKQMDEKTEKYLRKMIEYCRANDITLELIVAPYAPRVEDMGVLNQAEQIASEYGLELHNYAKDPEALGLDYTTDYADIGHMNWRGSTKFTRVLGDYLTDKYTFAKANRTKEAIDSHTSIAADDKARRDDAEAAAVAAENTTGTNNE